MVGDPGIEPGVRLREGVTVPCHTLRPVAHREALNIQRGAGRQPQNPLRLGEAGGMVRARTNRGRRR